MSAAYDAVVYDLDGTLVRLAVDWSAVADDVAALLSDAGHEADGDGWELLSTAETVGLGDEAHERIASHEREGARRSERLPLADRLEESPVPVGVCSLNDADAVRIALDRHDLSPHVDAVVGRGTVPRRKPHPRPLRRAVADLGATPERTLFVGDSASDETTAARAGTAFATVEDALRDDPLYSR